MIELCLLEQLAAFSRRGTLSGAAKELHISQPALSQSMKKLEEGLGIALFERTKNRLVLNENGWGRRCWSRAGNWRSGCASLTGAAAPSPWAPAPRCPSGTCRPCWPGSIPG